MRHGNILLDRNLASQGIHHARRNGECAASGSPRSREVCLGEALEVRRYGDGLTIRKEQTYVADEVFGKKMCGGLVLVLGGSAECLGHDFGLAKEYSAICKLAPHILQVSVAHVLDGEDETVLVVVETLAHIIEELYRQLLALFIDFGQVNHSCALRFGH